MTVSESVTASAMNLPEPAARPIVQHGDQRRCQTFRENAFGMTVSGSVNPSAKFSMRRELRSRAGGDLVEGNLQQSGTSRAPTDTAHRRCSSRRSGPDPELKSSNTPSRHPRSARSPHTEAERCSKPGERSALHAMRTRPRTIERGKAGAEAKS